MSDAEEILKETQAAGLGKMKANTFRKYRQLGIGPPFLQISARCIRYRRADVLAWLESRRVVPEVGRKSARAAR